MALYTDARRRLSSLLHQHQAFVYLVHRRVSVAPVEVGPDEALDESAGD